MKTFKIITLFPEQFASFVNFSIIKKAITNNLIKIELINPRDFALNKHHQVDDYPYGGGAGMVLMASPVIAAIKAASINHANKIKTILLTPHGQQWNSHKAYAYSQQNNDYIFICGHYEGIDDRISKYVDEEISLGDYVLTGGELVTMVIIDSIVRLIPGVIKQDSHLQESFNNNLLDYPAYTRPQVVDGVSVPDVLISGNHAKIKQWQQKQSLLLTYLKRPDLWAKYELSSDDKTILLDHVAAILQKINNKSD